MIKELDNQSFSEEIANLSEGTIKYKITKKSVIEFYLSDCPHCIAMEPIYEKSSENFPDINFYQIEASLHPEISQLYKIQGTPAFILLSLKDKPKIIYGEMSSVKLDAILREYFH